MTQVSNVLFLSSPEIIKLSIYSKLFLQTVVLSFRYSILPTVVLGGRRSHKSHIRHVLHSISILLVLQSRITSSLKVFSKFKTCLNFIYFAICRFTIGFCRLSRCNVLFSSLVVCISLYRVEVNLHEKLRTMSLCIYVPPTFFCT